MRLSNHRLNLKTNEIDFYLHYHLILFILLSIDNDDWQVDKIFIFGET